MALFYNNAIIGASGNQGGAAGYQISRSLRFNSADSAYLSRTPASAGNRKTWTFAFWYKKVKNSQIGLESILGISTGSTTYFTLRFVDTGGVADYFRVEDYPSYSANTLSVFRDPSAWYHFVVAVDTTQSTASERVKVYVNGISQPLSAQPSQNFDFLLNTANRTDIGNLGATYNNYYLNGYLADIHFIDGQALTPSSFAETNATTGQWVPKAYTGSYGTNGFQLTFADNSNNTATTLGKDTSGNGNNWTPVNVSTGISIPSPVSSSTGALPIYNTTDTYGGTKGTGTRTDSNSSSIVLAVAMDGTNGGTTFSDLSATIKGSGSAKTITNSNVTTATAQSKYYGSSGIFDSNIDNLTVPAGADFAYGTGDVTWECWVYPTSYPNTYVQVLWSQDSSGVNYLSAGLLGNFFGTPGKFAGFGVTSTYVVPLNRWTHLAAVRSSGVVSLYVNGVSVATGSNTTNYSDTSRNPAIGGYPWDTTSNFYGYMQDVRVYKGVAKYTSNFIPPASTGDPYINAACDSLVDTPTSYGTGNSGGDVRGNYATLNPLKKASVGTLSNGNLDFAFTADGSFNAPVVISTIQLPTSGKWYFEMTAGGASGFLGQVGLFSQNFLTRANDGVGQKYVYLESGYVYNVSGELQSGLGTYTSGDIIGVAYDSDTNSLRFYKNGNAVGSAVTPSTSYSYFFGVGVYDKSCSVNFGQRPFAFPVSGFKALCDTNLPAPTIAKPSTVMDVLLWTGSSTSSGRTFSGLNFSPDFVWAKNRSGAGYSHNLYDTNRGAGKMLVSNGTDSEYTNNQFGYISAFNSDGFTTTPGSSNNSFFNELNASYVAWTWDAGSSTVTNTSGSISSQVRANASAGFSIVSYTGNGVQGATVGHGLGVAPSMVIYKSRDGSLDWLVYHSALGATQGIYLNQTLAAITSANFFNNTAPNSTTLYLNSAPPAGQTNTNGNRHLAYCFAPVAGYSSMGAFSTATASTDGVFVYTNHRPRWVLIKKTSATGPWIIYDAVRNTYNAANNELRPNTSEAENGGAYLGQIDILSNGFKIRSNSSAYVGETGDFVYCSFAENPFQYARAR